MGITKRLLERGVHMSAYRYYVCAYCFADSGIRDFIKGEVKSNTCDFCGCDSDEQIAAPLEEVRLHIRDSLLNEYDLAANKLPYEGKEGGYIGDTWQTEEILLMEELELPNDSNGKLMDAIVNGLDDELWCQKHPFSLPDDKLLEFSWDSFCQLIKTRRRFFFLHEEYGDSELYSPLALLKSLTRWCEEFDLVKTFFAGHKFYRARCQKEGVVLSTAADFGPPPAEKATMPNRMSPPGIVMFYVGDTPATALKETAMPGKSYAIGEFEILRDITILNFVDMPPVPSIFEVIPDSLEYNPRPPAKFLHHFAEELSKPIAGGDDAGIEYVPTQIITEYFRSEFTYQGEKIDGIQYYSARHPGHCALVLFADQMDLVCERQNKNQTNPAMGSAPWIKLVNHWTCK